MIQNLASKDLDKSKEVRSDCHLAKFARIDAPGLVTFRFFLQLADVW